MLSDLVKPRDLERELPAFEATGGVVRVQLEYELAIQWVVDLDLKYNIKELNSSEVVMLR